MDDDPSIKARYGMVASALDERARRLVLGAEARVLGHGGVSVVSRATGVARSVISHGISELSEPALPDSGRIRRPGAGRKRSTEKDPSLRQDLEGLVEPTSRGDPESPLRWTCKSVRVLASELRRMGHQVCPQVVANLLHGMEYSLQGNSKTLEGSSIPTATRSSSISTHRSRTFRQPGSR